MSNVYLETSGRRSGKTTRLLKEFWKNPNNSYIVVPHIRMLYHLPSIPTYRIITVSRLRDGQRYNRGNKYNPLNSRLLWDEFDLGEDGTEFIKAGDYYTTTPLLRRTKAEKESWERSERGDMLLSLLSFNRHSYERYTLSKHQLLTIKENADPSIYPMEWEGSWSVGGGHCGE